MKPLEGVTVLDFTQAYSGPYCTLNLADYGARVIKVERLGYGDQTREWAPLRPTGESGYYALYNRNKEGITVNLRDEKGVEIIKKLVEKADIVVNNFKIGTLDKLGLGYEEMKKINPNIIFASISGYGSNGPMAGLAAYDNIIEATCGLMEQSGFPDREPIRSGASIGDSYTGLNAAVGIAASYYHRLKTGEGQEVDVAMQDALFAGLEDTILAYYGNNNMLNRQGNSRAHMVSPYDVVKCKDGWVAIAAITDEGFREYCSDAGRNDLAEDPRFTTNDLRCKNNDALIEEMKKDFADLSFDEIESKFSCKKFAASPVLDSAKTIKAKHMADRDMVVKIDDHYVGPFDAVGIPIKFEKTPGEIQKGSSLLGEYTDKVLSELGYTREEIDELREAEVI